MPVRIESRGRARSGHVLRDREEEFPEYLKSTMPPLPTERKIRQVPMRTAMVIPESGLEDEPTMPVPLADTTENKNPKRYGMI
jgi:hypothetical protein